MKKVKLLSVLFATLLFVINVFANNNDSKATAVPTSVADGVTVHYQAPVNGTSFGGTINASVGGQNVKLYCIDLTHHLQWNTDYIDAGNTSPEITYILNNYYPYVTNRADALQDARREAAAVQGAIWTFSDGLAEFTSPADVEARRQQIVADALTNAGNTTPVQTLVINPNFQTLGVGNDASFTVEAYDENNAPVENVEVHLTTTDGTLSETTVYTDATGSTPVIYLTQGTQNNVTVTATAEVVIPQGTKFVRADNPDQYQKLVLATPTNVERETTAQIQWFEATDLVLTKTVNDENPEDGDVITFTITVSNQGQANSSCVEVTDLLPLGLDFVSANPSQGNYDENTGIWTVGDIDAGNSATLTIDATVNYLALNNAPLTLGVASDYNVFVLNDVNQPSSDTQGKMAVGRNATLSNYSVGDALPPNSGDVLVVGRKITYTSGRIYNGNLVYGRFQDIGTVSVDGTIRQDTIIDFTAARSYLYNLSDVLRDYAENGTVTFEWGKLTLTGNNPYINVFNIDGNDLSAANDFEVNAPNGSVVIVNISRRDVSWSGGATVVGTSKENVIYNFYKARHITISGIAVLGTILAPKASVNFISGVQHGQMICKNLTGQGQFNLAPFIGNIPVNPDITNSAEITNMSNQDIDSTNNVAQVTIHIDLGDSNGGGNGGNGGSSNWELVNQIGSELIWTMTYDNAGNALYGTWGGKVYRNENGQNTVINEGMNVGYIWSIAVDPVNDKIWVATENGVYISRDNGASWELRGLAGKDVRAIIAVGEDHVWAGTWGSGIYELSQGTGYQFVERNDGLTFTAVHALALNSNGDIYAGTFGGGVMKLENGSGSWTATTIPYSYVWALGIDNNDKIYAGTYGGGVYVSNDNGGSWTTVNDGLANNYIYSITINPSDEVFASAWGAGVYKLNTSKDVAWSELGMSGLNVTSVATGADGYVYAATEDGKVYKYIDKPLSADDNATVEKFELAQNYPNPFNPTTKISFSVAKAGNYELAVYNLLGQKIATLISGNINAGSYEVTFDANSVSDGLASGIYIYRLQGEGVNFTKKMMLMK